MTTYRINDHEWAAAYAVRVLAAIAFGDYPANTSETAEEYAQRHLDQMVTEGSIEVES